MMGPLISARQREKVAGYVDRAIADGAKAVVGGRIPEHLPRGFFYEPTLLVGADENSAVAQDELFGPVLVVLPHDGDDDAVRIANNSIFGLSGSVLSADRDRALAVGPADPAGTMSVNGGLYYGPDAPFGGYKQSGIGREMGRPGSTSSSSSRRCRARTVSGASLPGRPVGDREHRQPRVARGDPAPGARARGCLVYDPAKAGVDAGLLCGEEPVGVVATDDRAAARSIEADCVLYMPRVFDIDDVVALLESGTNIVTTRGELFGGGHRLGDDGRARVLDACARGSSSIYATGSSPGFITDALPFALLSCSATSSRSRSRSSRTCRGATRRTCCSSR